jgi:hypothetical protein
MIQRLSTLNEVEAAIWEELQRSARDRSHAWHTAVLATVDGDGADARTVVLREADAGSRQLRIYSDSRAGKVAQLQAHPVAMLVLWSSLLGWQLRCRLHCEIADDGIAVSSRWTGIKLSPAAQDYLSPLPPGSALDAQTPALVHREYFAVITARVLSIDWLELHPDGHRRARFGDGPARWLQP